MSVLSAVVSQRNSVTFSVSGGIADDDEQFVVCSGWSMEICRHWERSASRTRRVCVIHMCPCACSVLWMVCGVDGWHGMVITNYHINTPFHL